MDNVDYFGLVHEEAHLNVIRRLRGLTPSDAIIVEVGAYVGGSTLAFLAEDRKVFCVDPWNRKSPDYGPKDTTMEWVRQNGGGKALFETFCKNTKEHLFKNIFPIRAYSDEAAKIFPFEIDLLYIDGVHTYEGVMTDFHSWKHLLKTSAIVAFDDYGLYYDGVKRAVDELVGADIESFHPNWMAEKSGIVHCKISEILKRI
jgi:hypothetical protein